MGMKGNPLKVGEKFGKRTALGEFISQPNGHSALEKVQCECGLVKYVQRGLLRQGQSKGCRKCSGYFFKKHGVGKEKFWTQRFSAMIQRCTNKKNKGYKNYGGRGIKCLWKDVGEFKKDMEPALIEFKKINPNATPSIERIDVNGDYCKENCTRIDNLDQVNNRRKTLRYFVDGKYLTIREISKLKECIVSYIQLKKRLINLKWDIKKAMTTPIMENPRHFNIDGKWLTLKEICDLGLSKVDIGTLIGRLGRGRDIYKSISTPFNNTQKNKWQ